MTTYYILGLVALGVLILIASIAFLISRYRRCPSDQILVVFGKAGKTTIKNEKTGKNEQVILPSKVIHGGGTFVWPVIQDYKVMSLAPLQIQETIDGRSKENINVHIPITLTTSIGTSEVLMQNAASRVLSLNRAQQVDLLKDILIGEVRNLIANLTVVQLKEDRDAFLGQAKEQIDPELNKLGFEITNLNSADVKDDAQILDSLSKRASTEAKAKADADIAEQEKIGKIKVANTKKEEAIALAEAEKEQQTTVSETNQAKETKVAEINRIKAEQLAETKRQQTIALRETSKKEAVQQAEIAKDEETSVANLATEQETAVAEAEAVKIANVAKAKADAMIKSAQFAANAEAESTKAKAESLALQAEAKAKQESATQKALQEKEAQIAEFAAQKEQRRAIAERDANVAQQMANIEIAKAEGEAAKAEQESIQKANTAKVVAELEVAKEQQVRQLEVNKAEAEATRAKLNAEKVVVAEAEKEVARIAAEQNKQVLITENEAEAESAKIKAQGQAAAISAVAEAEAKATELKGNAEAAAIKARLQAEADVEVGKAKGLSEAEVAGIRALAVELGDPQAALSFFLRETNRDIETAKAYAGSLHEIMGNVTVYGDSNTASSLASNLLTLVPQIKEMGKALGEGVNTVKEAFTTSGEFEEVQ